MKYPLRSERGFTLIEILVVMIIMCLSVALVTPSIMRGLGRAGLKTTTKKIASSLKYSRNQALRKRRVYYAVARGKDLIIIPAGQAKPEAVISAATGTEVVSRDGRALVFYPGGGSSGGMLKVMDSKKGSFYTIKVEPSSGRVHVSALM